MSIKAMTLVWDNANAKGSELLLLLAIADYADDKLANAYPSVETLAKKIRMTPRNTQLLLRKLADTNQLEIKEGGGVRGTHRYRLILDDGGEKFSGEKFSGGVKNSASGGEKFSPLGVKAISPDPSLDPSKNHILAPDGAEDDSPVEKPRPRNLHWDALVEGVGVEVITDGDRKTVGMIAAEFKRNDVTPEEILLACKTYREEWPNTTLTWTAIRKHLSTMLAIAERKAQARKPKLAI